MHLVAETLRINYRHVLHNPPFVVPATQRLLQVREHGRRKAGLIQKRR